MLKKTISLVYYNCKVKLIIADDINPYIKRRLKKMKFDVDKTKYEGMVITNSSKLYFIYLSLSHIGFNLLAHEIDHVCDLIQKDRCIEDMENKAWIVGFLHNEIYKFIIDNNIPIKLTKGAKCQNFRIIEI